MVIVPARPPRSFPRHDTTYSLFITRPENGAETRRSRKDNQSSSWKKSVGTRIRPGGASRLGESWYYNTPERVFQTSGPNRLLLSKIRSKHPHTHHISSLRPSNSIQKQPSAPCTSSSLPSSSRPSPSSCDSSDSAETQTTSPVVL